MPPGQQLESPGVLASMGLGWVEEVRDMGEVGLPSGQESLWEVEESLLVGDMALGSPFDLTPGIGAKASIPCVNP